MNNYFFINEGKEEKFKSAVLGKGKNVCENCESENCGKCRKIIYEV